MDTYAVAFMPPIMSLTDEEFSHLALEKFVYSSLEKTVDEHLKYFLEHRQKHSQYSMDILEAALDSDWIMYVNFDDTFSMLDKAEPLGIYEKYFIEKKFPGRDNFSYILLHVSPQHYW